MTHDPVIDAALAEVGARLRRLRTRRGVTLAALAEATGISKSTLSRLETGERRPSFELLLPIALAHRVPLDELVAAPQVPDPRVAVPARAVHGRTILPLTRQPGAVQAYKITIPGDQKTPDLRTHDGYEWLYVLSGRLRLILADHDLVLRAGEAAEFDTSMPHWFGVPSGGRPVEVLSLFSREGERVHLRARARPPRRPDSGGRT